MTGELTEVELLFSRIVDGVQSPHDEERLAELLQSDADARRIFRRLTRLHSSLHWGYAAAIVPDASAPAPTSGRAWLPYAAAIAIFLAAAAMTTAAWLSGVGEPDRAADVAGIGTVTRTRFLTYENGREPWNAGDAVNAGRIEFEDGAIQITLRNGVTIMLEGPVDFDLHGEMEAFLREGVAVVRMPEGLSGFRLRTSTTNVLDLGTEFAVKAGAGLVTDVQVYDGAVIASSNSLERGGRFPKRLEAGQSARFLPQAAGEPIAIPYDGNRFVRRLAPDLPPETASESERRAQQRWSGRPYFDTIAVQPAIKPIVIDGRLDEWGRAAGFARSGHPDAARRAEWADGWMMYDAGDLYIAAHVKDPYPMRSTIDPAVDADLGWRGGSVQVRLSTDRIMGWPVHANSDQYFADRGVEPTAEQKAAANNPRLAHLTMWFHAPSKTPCLTIGYGMLAGQLAVNPEGFRGGFVSDADGKGYTLEYSIPWSLLRCPDDPPQSGDVLAAIWQVHWGDEGGHLRRDHCVEIRNPAEPLRINSWHRASTWGRAEYQ
jgi:ferric-dicitrate binding protein FerR (iron transport regulator)